MKPQVNVLKKVLLFSYILNFLILSKASAETLLGSMVPQLTSVSDGSTVRYELGMKFTSIAPGTISAIRFYKSPSETGQHIGKIYSATGSLLASVIFSNETASGYQQQSLTTPLAISPNTVYVVSVNTGGSYYVKTDNGMANQLTSASLRSIVGNNGVFGAPGAMPTKSVNNTNYFRDVVFTSASQETLLGSLMPQLMSVSDGSTVRYELGMKFTSIAPGKISAIRFYKSPSETGQHIGKIYSATGSLLASIVFSNETASGYQQQNLTTPLAIAANTVYVVSVNTGGPYYVKTDNGMANQLTSASLRSIVGNNGVFGAPGAMPAKSVNNTNYFRDVVFTSGSGSSTAPISQPIASPAPAPSPTPLPAPISGDTATNYTVQTLLNDMGLPNDSDVLVVPGPPSASITMGLMRGDAVASWVPQLNPQVSYLCNANTYWYQANPWFVINAGVGNKDGSTYIEFRNAITYYLMKSTGKWKAVYQPMDQTWAYNWNGYNVSTKVQPDGHTSYLIPGNTDQYIHGGNGGKFPEDNPADVIAIHHQFEARLVMDPASYNQNYTRRLIQVGLDLIPYEWPSSMSYTIAAGSSRSKFVTPQWQVFSMTTVQPSNTRNIVDTPLNSSLKTYLTEAELRANPPPGFTP
ncbi:MAG: DUF4082 domain-containing protein [Bdellovibrio sp.]